MLPKAELVSHLHSMGVTPGDHLGLGLSYKSLGPIEGGPDALLEALMEAVGPQGTILLPSFTIPSAVPPDYIFDQEETPAYTGLIPEIVRRHRASQRSRHPTCSVVAMGRLASRFTEGHDETTREYLPYTRLAQAKGKFLAIGIGDNLVSIRHEAQHLAGLLELVPGHQRIKFRATDGTIKTFLRKYRGGCAKTLPCLVPMMRQEGMVTDGRIGAASAVLVAADQSLKFMAQKLTDQPELNLCSAITCLWCRHLERTLNLYDRIQEPRFFQRFVPVRCLLAWVNAIRLKDIPLLTRVEVAIKRWVATG